MLDLDISNIEKQPSHSKHTIYENEKPAKSIKNEILIGLHPRDEDLDRIDEVELLGIIEDLAQII